MCWSALTFAERFKIMQTKITKTIRVSIDVKQHLDEMKGSVSASEFIETMLSYFERNGVDPRTSINGKFKTLELQGIERIIKIIRAIEKDKIDKLLPAPEATCRSYLSLWHG